MRTSFIGKARSQHTRNLVPAGGVTHGMNSNMQKFILVKKIHIHTYIPMQKNKYIHIYIYTYTTGAKYTM